MGLDISLLETFTLVADLGSFSAAARRLGLTQPAISLQIKSLEKELAAPLIDRSRGQVVLTPAGRTAYTHAKKILADRELMITDIPRATGRVAGQLMLGASTIPGEYLLPPVLSEFRTMYPEVSISLEISDSGGVLRSLRSERIELGFVGAKPESDIASRRFAEDRLVLITPPHHPLSVKRKQRLDTLAGERFVDRIEGSGTRKKFEKVLEKAGLSKDGLDIVAEMSSHQAVISAVQAGMGLSIVSNKAAEQAARSGMLAMIEISGVDLSREFYMIHAKERPLSVAAEAFMKTVSSAK